MLLQCRRRTSPRLRRPHPWLSHTPRHVSLLLAGTAAVLVLTTSAGAITPTAEFPKGEVDITKDLAYAPAEPPDTQGHLLDLYVPRSRKPVPLAIFSSGSGWLADSGRRGADEVAAHLNPHGFAVAGVAIRSSSQARFPAQLHDIKGAIRWLRAHSKTYNLDPHRIAIMGDSSGGWTTAMAAVTGDIPQLEGDVGPRGPSTTVQAAVPFYPPTDFLQMDAHMPDGCTTFNAVFGLTDCHADARSPESLLLGGPIKDRPGIVAAANPLTYIGDRHTPPFLIFHGKQDPFVPYHQGRLLFEKLAAAGNDARLISFPHAGHGPFLDMLSDPDTRRDAYEEAAHHGQTTPARPVTLSWQTVLAFLEQRLKQTPR
jgi:acetyl esterase/lipase